MIRKLSVNLPPKRWVMSLSLVVAALSQSSTVAIGKTEISGAPEAQATPSVNSSEHKPDETTLLLNRVTDVTIPHRMFSLHACFDKADKENKQILVTESSLPVAAAAIVIAKAIPNPTYSLMYGFGNSWRYVIAGNAQGFGWAEEIQVAGKRTKKTEVARANCIQAAFQLEAMRFDAHNKVRRAYAELAAAHAYADVIESQRAIARKLRDISQKRYDAGKAPGYEVIQAKLALMQLDPQANQAWGRIVQDSAHLAWLLGEETPPPEEIIDVEANGLFNLSTQKNVLVPDPDRELPPLQQLLPVAWRERNDLKVEIQTAYANRKALTLAKTKRIPDPTVGFSYFFSTFPKFQFGFFDQAGVLPYLQGLYPNVPLINAVNPSTSLVQHLYYQSIFSGAGAASGGPVPDINQDKVPFQPGYQLTLQHETPVFYQYQGEIAQAKGTWEQQLKQNDQLRAQIAADIVTAYESVLVTKANIKTFQKQILPAAARMAYMTRRGYELGKMDLATTMLAQQQYQQLLSSYFDAVVAYQNAWADMEKAVGVPLTL